MTNESTMTSPEVCQKHGINRYTLLNWRRGYYFHQGKKVWYFDDESSLEAEWNDKLRRLEYSPIKVAVWVNKLKIKNERSESK